MSDLAKLVQRYERNDLNSLEREDGTTTTPGVETIDELRKAHFPKATEVKRIRYNLEGDEETKNIKGKYWEWINPTKIINALNAFKGGKSPGPDGLKPVVFKYVTSKND